MRTTLDDTYFNLDVVLRLHYFDNVFASLIESFLLSFVDFSIALFYYFGHGSPFYGRLPARARYLV
jgi:hypothetical protein